MAKENKIYQGFRLEANIVKKLKEVSKDTGKSKTSIVEDGLKKELEL